MRAALIDFLTPFLAVAGVCGPLVYFGVRVEIVAVLAAVAVFISKIALPKFLFRSHAPSGQGRD